MAIASDAEKILDAVEDAGVATPELAQAEAEVGTEVDRAAAAVGAEETAEAKEEVRARRRPQ